MERGKSLVPSMWVDDPGSQEQKMIRRHGPAVTSSSGSRRTVARWRGERTAPKRGHDGDGGDTDEPSVEWTDEGGWGTSLVAAITVSGRHALLVGYQPDEALRPSPYSLPTPYSLSLLVPPALLSLTLFRNLLVSAVLQVVPRARRGGRESLSTELYTCMRSPES